MSKQTGTNNPIIAPSILSADFANLEKEIKIIEDAGADWLHVDVMDGHFVPNLTIGPPVVAAISKHTKLPLDVHLMISEPWRYLSAFAEAGTWLLTFHIETCKNDKDVMRIITNIKKLNMKAGISIKPHTPVQNVFPFLEKLDLVMVMTVEPGFGGQKFMPRMLSKMKLLREQLQKRNAGCLIEVDGGINQHTAKVSAISGANVFVAGNYIYNSKNPAEAINSLRTAVRV